MRLVGTEDLIPMPAQFPGYPVLVDPPDTYIGKSVIEERLAKTRSGAN
jgi:hypothetical protein